MDERAHGRPAVGSDDDTAVKLHRHQGRAGRDLEDETIKLALQKLLQDNDLILVGKKSNGKSFLRKPREIVEHSRHNEPRRYQNLK